MQAFAAVLKDLWCFAISSDTLSSLPTLDQPALPSPTPTQLVIPAAADQKNEAIAASKQLAPVTPGASVYLKQRAALRLFPGYTFDDVQTMIPVGSRLLVTQTRTDWIEVVYHEYNGWIKAAWTTTRQHEVEPVLRPDGYCSAHQAAVKCLRRHIQDAFAAGAAKLPLHDVEYVTYRLQQSNQVIAWPDVRPRISGTWQRVLKGVRGIHMGVHPKTGSIMEVIHKDGAGTLWYVEAVFPDLAVRVTGIDQEHRYQKKTIASKEWREYRPVFITVS